MIDVKVLTHAIVEVEEEYISAHPECLNDTCDHDECPDWESVGCGDAQRIADHYERLMKLKEKK